MISAESFINLLQDKTIIELDETTKLIQDTIKTSFTSIQDQLVEKIKNNVRDQLIDKIGSSDNITDDQFKRSLEIGHTVFEPMLKADEFIIGSCVFRRNIWNFSSCSTQYFSIIYTNYNDAYQNRLTPVYKSNKKIKLSRPMIIMVSKIFKSISTFCNFVIPNGNGGDESYGDQVVSFLTKTLPEIVYEIQEKYYGDKKFGIYGCKFEEIIEDYHKLTKEMQIKNTALENAKREMERLYGEVDRLNNELSECDQLKKMLLTLKNTV